MPTLPDPDYMAPVGSRKVSVEFNGRHWTLVVPGNDHIGAIVERTKAPYESDLLRFTCELLRADDLVVDVGANIGNHSLCWAVSAGARVLSVEGNPVALAYLNHNVVLNDMSKRIEVAPVALGAINGRAGVTSAVEGNLGATGIVAHPGGSISMRRLDDLLGVVVGGVKLLKIDVEGTEAQVLSGAMVTLTESHPLIIAEAATEDEVWAIDDILREYGYQREPANLAATPTYLWR